MPQLQPRIPLRVLEVCSLNNDVTRTKYSAQANEAAVAQACTGACVKSPSSLQYTSYAFRRHCMRTTGLVFRLRGGPDACLMHGPEHISYT